MERKRVSIRMLAKMTHRPWYTRRRLFWPGGRCMVLSWPVCVPFKGNLGRFYPISASGIEKFLAADRVMRVGRDGWRKNVGDKTPVACNFDAPQLWRLLLL